MIICLECYTIFENDSFLAPSEANRYFVACPVFHCPGEVVEIDENFFEAIRILNQKDYTTIACCSGHTWNPNSYITFQDFVSEYSFDSFPNGFKSTTPEVSRLNISKIINADTTLERLKQLFDTSIDVYKWAHDLPTANRYMISFELNPEIEAYKFLEKIRTELHLYNMYGDNLQTDPFKIIGPVCLAAGKVELFTLSVESFAKANGVKVSVNDSN